MRSASEAILATSLTAPAIPETVALARDAASPRDSAFCATEAMNAAISSTVAVVSPTVPARLSRSRAIWSMDTVICSMVADALGDGVGEGPARAGHLLDGGAHLRDGAGGLLDVAARPCALPATVWMEAAISSIEVEVSSAACACPGRPA